MKTFIFALTLLFVSSTVLAGESSRAECSDGVDNDGDGHIDCADQDCWDLVICQHVANPAPARKSGYTKLVLGAILLPLGVILGAVSAAPWVIGADHCCSTQEANYAAAGVLDALALAGISSGAALLAIGVGDVAGSHDRASLITVRF